MKFTEARTVVKAKIQFKLATGLMLRSGLTGESSDSTIEMTPDGRLHVNGYVWASLFRRALSRVAGAEILAQRIGKFGESEMKVSPLWCESSFVESPQTVIRSGNRISRLWGSVEPQALFSDEVVAAGHGLVFSFNYFCDRDETPESVKAQIQSALWVIHQGIETIGAGWSYGYGRLKLTGHAFDILDLTRQEDRQRLWRFEDKPHPVDKARINTWQPAIRPEKAWARITAYASIMAGQLLAISTKIPPLDVNIIPADKLPDSFVFRGTPKVTENGGFNQPVLITGKAIRQALLAVPIERELISLETTDGDGKSQHDNWFGSTDHRGLVSVTDAEVCNPDTVVLNRIQLCEHSMQNNNLFSGEYLCRGNFTMNVLVETGDDAGKNLAEQITAIFEEMKLDGNVPPGWHRLGHTSTCTGQIETTGLSAKNFGGES